MSSLWTPGGEVPVGRESSQPQPPRERQGAGAQAPPPDAEPVSLEDLTPEQREQAEAMLAQMAEAQQQIAATPAEQIVATHAAGLYELAVIKLNQQPPMLDDARLAIDALAVLVEGVGARLGADSGTIQDMLRTLQLGFVQIKERAEG